MTENTSATESTSHPLEIAEVMQWVDTGKRFLLLDVRNADESERWKLEGLRPVETLSIPYQVIAARMGDLRRNAPELAITREDEFLETMKAGVREAPAVYTDIIHVNLGLKSVDEEKATEWELGKNECAATAHKAKLARQAAEAAAAKAA